MVEKAEYALSTTFDLPAGIQFFNVSIGSFDRIAGVGLICLPPGEWRMPNANEIDLLDGIQRPPRVSADVMLG